LKYNLFGNSLAQELLNLNIRFRFYKIRAPLVDARKVKRVYVLYMRSRAAFEESSKSGFENAQVKKNKKYGDTERKIDQ